MQALVVLRFCAALAFFLFSCDAVHAAPQTEKPAHHKPAKKQETDFDCAVQTAYGEARNTSRTEEAVVINLLLNRARREHMSVCHAAHKFFKPRKGSTPGILAAAENVVHGDKSMVPPQFRRATEMRAFDAPQPPPTKYRRLGSVDARPDNGLHGNVFYQQIRN